MENQFDAVPEVEPLNFRAGDHVQWRKPSLSKDYPPDLYGLEYVAVLETDASTKFTLSATAVDSVFTVEALNATTAAIAPGVYRWALAITRNSDNAKRTLDQGRFEVLPDLSAATGDQRSHNERMLDQIEALLEGRAKSDAASYEIAGRKITKLSPGELTEFAAHYRRLVRKERDRRAGKATGRKIHKVRFR